MRRLAFAIGAALAVSSCINDSHTCTFPPDIQAQLTPAGKATLAGFTTERSCEWGRMALLQARRHEAHTQETLIFGTMTQQLETKWAIEDLECWSGCSRDSLITEHSDFWMRDTIPTLR